MARKRTSIRIPQISHHFFVEEENELVDIPAANVTLHDMPGAPEGYEIVRFDVVVDLKRKSRGCSQESYLTVSPTGMA